MDNTNNKPITKPTVFQRMTKIFGPDGVRVPVEVKQTANKYDINKNDIFVTKSKEAFEQAKLQKQQSAYLNSNWKRVNGELYQQSLQYETTRIGSYVDFEAMEYFPEISAAWDIFMEESTVPGPDGKILNIYSESKRVRDALNELFFNVLDIHTNLPAWTRSTVKYGDDFIFLRLEEGKGITGVRQMPNLEIERREGDLYESLQRRNGLLKGDEDNDTQVKFLWKTHPDVEFNSWNMAHFRLFGNDRSLPYGQGIMEKARRVWRLLLMAEDAMLVYRLTRASDRRVFKVFVGNMDPADYDAYMDKIANNFKRKSVVDPLTGQLDLRTNMMAETEDFFIPDPTGTLQMPIETLAGASNMDQIADIEYLLNKLCVAIRVPKPFLGFSDSVGEGKNLALIDIRFGRTINRIQQSMIMELNKIAMIHLYTIGLEDEFNNFTLSLNNPSTQADMLRIEQAIEKINAYKAAVEDAGNGFGAMSMTQAQKEIMGKSNDEIKQMLLEQRLEKAAASEMLLTDQLIKHTGFFDKVDNIYANPEMLQKMKNGELSAEEQEGGPSGGGGGGMGGGGGLSGGLGGEFPEEEGQPVEGAETEGNLPGGGTPVEGETPGMETEPGAEEAGGAPTTPEKPEKKEEGEIKKMENLLLEQKRLLEIKMLDRINKYRYKTHLKQNNYFNDLIENLDKGKKIITDADIIEHKSNKINENLASLMKNIDKITKK